MANDPFDRLPGHQARRLFDHLLAGGTESTYSTNEPGIGRSGLTGKWQEMRSTDYFGNGSTNKARNQAALSQKAKGRAKVQGMMVDTNGKTSSIYPGLTKGGAYSNRWGISAAQVQAATPQQMLKRANSFVGIGTGYKREALANSFGMITKRQAALKGTGAFLMKVAIPGITTLVALDSVSRGEGVGGMISNTALLTGSTVGFRAGQGYGEFAARAAGKGVGGIRALGLLGGGLGAITGGLALFGATELARSTTSSNNIIRQATSEVSKSDFTTDFMQTNQSLTQRQRALQKISKSALNDRGTILGHEASVLTGNL